MEHQYQNREEEENQKLQGNLRNLYKITNDYQILNIGMWNVRSM